MSFDTVFKVTNKQTNKQENIEINLFDWIVLDILQCEDVPNYMLKPLNNCVYNLDVLRTFLLNITLISTWPVLICLFGSS